MKKTLSIILGTVLLIALLTFTAFATAPVEENGISYSAAVSSSESNFSLQNPRTCEFFCANGIPITISAREDGVSGSLVTWEYEGVTYSKALTDCAIVLGGAWDTPVQSTSITMTGGFVRSGLFGGGALEGADVGSASKPGSVYINCTGGKLGDGAVGGGLHGDVYGDITLITGGDLHVSDNVIGGGFYGDVYGNINVQICGGVYGPGVSSTFLCGGGVFGNVYGAVDLDVTGGDVNGSVGGGSMISGTVTGNVDVEMTDGTVTDLVGGGIGFYTTYYGPSTVIGDTTVTVSGGVVEDIVAGGALGQFSECFVEGNTQVTISGGTIGGTSAGHTRNVYGGSVCGDVSGDVSVVITGGTLINDVVGGGNEGNVGGNVAIVISGGEIAGDVYAGSCTSGEVATNEGAEINVVLAPEVVDGEVLPGTASLEQFDPAEDVEDPTECVFGEWYVVTAPTCCAPGVERRDCTVYMCDKCETREISMLPHVMGDWTIMQSPTIVKDGYQTRTCVNPGCNYAETATIAATGVTSIVSQATAAFESLIAAIMSLFNSIKNLFNF